MNAKNWLLFILVSLFAITSCKKDNTNQHLSLSLQPNSSIGKDAAFSLIVPNSNYGSIPDIDIYAWTQSGALNINRVAIDFNLKAIPVGAKIDSAFLSLYFNKTSTYKSQHSGNNDFLIQRITSDWYENTVTWNSQPNSTTKNQVMVSKAIYPTQNFTKIDVTNMVQDMVDDKPNSYGFLLKFQAEEPFKILIFASSNNSDPTLRPKFDVYYTIK
jgi:hypothetical protein